MLKIENISKTFLNGTINEKTVIRNLSLTIEDSDFITVKSTLSFKYFTYSITYGYNNEF